jgi:hypothetical protein
VAADVGFAVYMAGCAKGLVEEPRQWASGIAKFSGEAEGSAYLSQHLSLADYHGVQSACHPEQMLSTIIAPVLIQMAFQMGFWD